MRGRMDPPPQDLRGNRSLAAGDQFALPRTTWSCHFFPVGEYQRLPGRNCSARSRTGPPVPAPWGSRVWDEASFALCPSFFLL